MAFFKNSILDFLLCAFFDQPLNISLNKLFLIWIVRGIQWTRMGPQHTLLVSQCMLRIGSLFQRWRFRLGMFNDSRRV